MTKTRFVLLFSLLGTLALGAGCKGLGGVSCLKAPPAADSQDHPPLKIPLGLDAPDTRAALKIPESGEPEAPRGANARCLEDPPLPAAADKPGK